MKQHPNKKERLLDAAAQAFWLDGYAPTSLAAIAKQADVPVGNVYYYFKSKAALAEGVADMFVAASTHSLTAIDQSAETPLERLRAFILMLKENAEGRTKHGCPIANAIRDFSAAAPKAAKRASETFDILIGWISQTLHKAGDRNAIRHARTALTRWQGAIILAHAACDTQLLIDTLNDLEADMTIWARSAP